MALRQEAVFMNAGSYVMSPKSSSSTLIFLRSSALIVPSLMGSSYVLPVRLSLMVRLSAKGYYLRRARNLSDVTVACSDDRRGHNRRCFGAQSPRAEAVGDASFIV